MNTRLWTAAICSKARATPREAFLTRYRHNSNTPPPIDLEIGTSDELPLITSKENGSIGNIRRLSQSLQRNALGKLLAVLRRVVDADKGREQLRGRKQRTDGVDADLLRAQLGC